MVSSIKVEKAVFKLIDSCFLLLTFHLSSNRRFNSAIYCSGSLVIYLDITFNRNAIHNTTHSFQSVIIDCCTSKTRVAFKRNE